MKPKIAILAVLLVQALAGDGPLKELKLPPGPVRDTFTDPAVSKIDLTPDQSVADAVKQIIAGLPPERRAAIAIDIPEAQLSAMPVRSDLKLRNTPISIVLRFLEQVSPVGSNWRNGAWHIGAERRDDVIAVEYRTSKESLEELGIVTGPSQLLLTKNGMIWPRGSESSASYTSLVPEPATKPEEISAFRQAETGILRVTATRAIQEEISAVLLLKERGYGAISLDR